MNTKLSFELPGARDSILSLGGRRMSYIPSVPSINIGPPVISIKCVIVGDKEVGKTCFLNSYVNPQLELEREYIPTVFDTFSVSKERNEAQVALGLYDTSGGDENQMLRLDTYSQTNVFIIAFSIDNMKSFENVKNKWIKEVEHFGSMGIKKSVPVMLVGMKSDTRSEAHPIRDDIEILNLEDTYFASTATRRRHPREATKQKKKTVSVSQANSLWHEIDAACYMECSSSDKTGIENVFEEVVKLGFLQFQKE
jgi:small GTP-binding protein